MDQDKKGIVCQPHSLPNLKIPKGVTITPVVQDEDNKVISLLKKLPNITFTCYNPKPDFKVPEPPKPIKINQRNGLAYSQNNNINNINQTLNMNVKNRKRQSHFREIPENYPEKENNLTTIYNYKEQCFYNYPNAKKPKRSETLLQIKPKDIIPTSPIIDLSDDNTILEYNSLSVNLGQSEKNNLNLKTNQNNKADYSIVKDTKRELNENMLLQEISHFCDNLVKQNSEVLDSSKPVRKNLEQPLKRKSNNTKTITNNTDKIVLSNSKKTPEKFLEKKNNQRTSSPNSKKTNKSETISKNKSSFLKTVTSAIKKENSALNEDYTLMDISTMGKVNIIPTPPPLDLLNFTDPGYDSFVSLGHGENENNNMAGETYSVLNDSQLLQRMTNLFCENLVETKPEIENDLLIHNLTF